MINNIGEKNISEKLLWQKYNELSDIFSAFREYTQGDLCKEINSALRLGCTDDFTVLSDIRKMDKMFANLPDTMKTKAPMRVYRGTLLCGELGDILSGKSDSNVYTDKGFVSTSKNKEVAKVFATLKKDAVLFDIIIPKGYLVLDDEKLPSCVGSVIKPQHEVLLPRNAQFEILSYDENTRVVKVVYLGQKKPLDMPKRVSEVSGFDILADINKGMLTCHKILEKN